MKKPTDEEMECKARECADATLAKDQADVEANWRNHFTYLRNLGVANGDDGILAAIDVITRNSPEQRPAPLTDFQTRLLRGLGKIGLMDESGSGNSAVPQPQDAASGASQGNVEREKGAEEAKLAYIVRFADEPLGLEMVLNEYDYDGYELVSLNINSPSIRRRYEVVMRLRKPTLHHVITTPSSLYPD